MTSQSVGSSRLSIDSADRVMGSYLSSVRRIATVVALAMFAYAVICAGSYQSSWRSEGAERADVIVVMGAAQYDGTPSEMLRQRLQRALELWRDGRASLVAVTGGKQAGDRFTEAQSGRRWLTDRGVPTSSILSEDVGRSTWQSLSVLAPVLRSRGIRNAIVVSSFWHVQRAELTLERLGFRTSANAVGSSSLSSWTTRNVPKELVGLVVGRVIGFHALYRITG